MKEIEMITIHNKDDTITPYRFRLVAEDESLVVVNVDKILFSEADRKGEIIKYRCECVIQDRKRIVDIYFKKMDMKWYLKV